MYNDVFIHSIKVTALPKNLVFAQKCQCSQSLVFGYIFLKQIGRVTFICCLDGQIIKQLKSFDNGFVHVVITFDTVVSDTWNLHAKSSCSKPRRNLVLISSYSCSNDNFFFGPFLSIGGRSFGSYNGDDNIIFILS